MNQHGIVLQHPWNDSTFPGIQIPQIRVPLHQERLVAREGEPVTRANLWTDQVTQQFIVIPRTVENAVADMAGMHTHGRGPAAIEPWTPVAGASAFVFSPWTVNHPVADDEDWETVAVTRTSEVGLWTLDGLVVCGVHACDCVAASSAEGDYPWWSVDCDVFVDDLQDRHKMFGNCCMLLQWKSQSISQLVTYGRKAVSQSVGQLGNQSVGQPVSKESSMLASRSVSEPGNE